MSRRRPRPQQPPATTVPAPADPQRTSFAILLAAALIIAVGLVAYAPSFKGLFVLDEQSAIAQNPSIKSLRTAFTAPAEVGLGGRPIASLSFALNYALAPAEARDAFIPPPPGYPPEAWDLLYRNLWGYHAANLAIHLIAALAAFGVMRRTLGSPRLPAPARDAATPLAFVTALLWVAHPLNTGAVTYVAQRVESQMGMFYLLSVYCAIRAGVHAMALDPAMAPDSAGASTARRVWTAAAVAACALGAGSKEVTVTLPFVVALYDLVFLGPPGTTAADLWRRRWPLYAGLAGVWVMTALLVATAPRAASVGFNLGWTPWLYLQTQAGIIVHYLRLVFVPWPLVLDYEWPVARSIGEVLPYAVPLAIAFGLSVWGLVRRHPLGFVGAWCFLILAPSSSVLPVVTEVAAEHRMYLPLVAILATVVAGAWLAARRVSPRPAMGVALTVVAALAIAGCTMLTRERNVDYQNEEVIWRDTVTKRPENSRALGNLAVNLIGQGRTAEAEPYLQRALTIKPDYPEALSAMGVVLATQGRVEEALPRFERAVTLEPTYADAWANYAEALGSVGRLNDALAAYRRVLTLKPDNRRALATAAWILATSIDDGRRDGAAALAYAERAVALTGGRDTQSLDSLAASLATLGRYPEAIDAVSRAEAAARASGLDGLVTALTARRQLYEAGQPYREGPG